MLGTIVCTLRIGNNIDRLNQLNNELKLELDNTLTELSELKAKRLEYQGYNVTKIETEISFLAENLTAAETEKLKVSIAKEVTKHYKSLVGSKVNSLNPTLLPKLIDGRLFKIDEKYYKIFVKTLVISETLFLSIEVAPQ
jgi:tRNA U54 and U55 pseudouridine synthase Pus10